MNDAIGRTRTQSDPLDPARAQALHNTLARTGADPAAGTTLPPFWHCIYFWHAQPPAALGRDGHAKTGEFIPDTGLARRMWAGGSLEFLSPVRLGQTAERTSTITDVEYKDGRSGALAIVTLSHDLKQSGGLCVRERQDLVYRADPNPKAPPPRTKHAPQNEDLAHSASFNPTLLFRYSALTFNGHRIHYDRDYCRTVEGYPGLVVHGPLLAQMLIHMADLTLGGLSQFRFRATAPLFDFEIAELCAKHVGTGLDLWVRGPDGRLCMTARASQSAG